MNIDKKKGLLALMHARSSRVQKVIESQMDFLGENGITDEFNTALLELIETAVKLLMEQSPPSEEYGI